jgi:hypothetical protein
MDPFTDVVVLGKASEVTAGVGGVGTDPSTGGTQCISRADPC